MENKKGDSLLPPIDTSVSTTADPLTSSEPIVTSAGHRPKAPSFPWIRMMLLALCFGYVGGKISQPDFWQNAQRLVRPNVSKQVEEPMKSPAILSSEDQSVVTVVEQASAAVVSIVVSKDVPRVRQFFGFPFFNEPTPEPEVGDEAKKQKIGSGSGFFVSQDGYIVTNKHVVADTRAEYTVITSDKKEYPATVLALDPINDVAVIKIDGSGFPALALGDSEQLQVGQTAIAIGNPLGEFANSVSRGIISGLKRQVTAGTSFGQEEVLRDIIQTDAAINPGNSGGPLLNLASEVVGINVAVAQGAENIGFAIPVNQIKRAVEEVRRTGRIAIPYIGVRYILLDKEIATQAGLSVDHGALIQRGQRVTDFAVIPGSPADKAGLMENDIILEVEGQVIDEEHPLANLINGYNIGDSVTLRILHKGEEKQVSVKLEERKQ